jgi:Fur family ferric uptake transcriptional regulator
MEKRKKEYLHKLNEAGLKKTKHRLLILDLLYKSDTFVSADDLYIKAIEIDHSISLSTIYRILESFSEHDIVVPVTIENNKQVYYELYHEVHMHHLICTECNKVIHIEGCPVHGFESDVAENYGFKIEKHRLDFYGICPECQEKQKNQAS